MFSLELNKVDELVLLFEENSKNLPIIWVNNSNFKKLFT
jgi:hypothetical protein